MIKGLMYLFLFSIYLLIGEISLHWIDSRLKEIKSTSYMLNVDSGCICCAVHWRIVPNSYLSCEGVLNLHSSSIVMMRTSQGELITWHPCIIWIQLKPICGDTYSYPFSNGKQFYSYGLACLSFNQNLQVWNVLVLVYSRPILWQNM